MNIYQINEKIENFLTENISEETGELLNLDIFASLELEKEEKVENTALAYKNQSAISDMLDKEIKVLQERKKTIDNAVKNLKILLDYALQGSKFETAKVKISYRKSKSLVVENWKNVPYDFLKIKDPDVDKASLKKAIEKGLTVQGAYILENNNIQIK